MAKKRGQHGTAPARSAAAGGTGGLRVIALAAIGIGLVILVALACVLSYPNLHNLASQAGVSANLAKIYPAILDAMLVIAGCSVLALRGAGLASRLYAWLCLVVILAGLAAGSVVHAAGITLQHKASAIAAATIPWVLVLIGFGLLLTLLGYARRRRGAGRAAELDEGWVPRSAQDELETGPVTLAGLASAEDAGERSDETPAELAPGGPGPSGLAPSGAGPSGFAPSGTGPSSLGPSGLGTADLGPAGSGGASPREPATRANDLTTGSAVAPVTGPTAPAAGAPTRPTARPADLQLRGRVPASRIPLPRETGPADLNPPIAPAFPGRTQPPVTPSPPGGGTGSTQPGSAQPGAIPPAGFTPPVILRPPGDAPPGAPGPAGTAAPGNAAAGRFTPPVTPMPSGRDSTAPTDPAIPATGPARPSRHRRPDGDNAVSGTAGQSSAAGVPASTAGSTAGQAEPEQSAEPPEPQTQPSAAPPAEPPALRRPHSSPTPPTD